MSQVDDWSDGYTSDYLRNLNAYGPASANVPRSSVVSHRVQYRAPDTSDIPLAPGQNPEGSVYSNAPGARMGQTKPASEYNPPAGGGYTAQTFPSSGGSGRRYARPKPAVKKKTQSTSKQQTQSASKQQPQPEYRTGGARTPEENEITRSAAEHRTDFDWGELNSQALDAAARFLPALKLLGFGAGAGSADTASTDRPSYMGAAGTMADNFARTLPQPSAASRQTAPESSSTEGQFENMPWYKDAKAHHEAVKKNVDDYGSALGMLKSTWDDIPWWTKLVMLPPVFKAGSPAAGASAAGNVWAEEGRAAAGNAAAGAAGDAAAGAAGDAAAGAAGDAAAGAAGNAAAGAAGDAAAGAAGDAAAGAGGRSFGFDLGAEDIAAANAANAAARQQAFNLSEMRSTLMHAGMSDREIEAYMHGAGFYNNPEALRQAIDVVRKHGMAGLFEHSAAEAAAARAGSAAGTGAGSAAGTGAGSAAGTGAGSAAGTGARGSFRFDLSPEEIASAKASHDAYVRGAAGAADGGVSELANAGNVGRETAAGGAAARQGAGEAAGALAPQLQRDLSAVRQKVSSEGDSFERIRDVLRTSGGRQELLPANIREACEPLRRIVEQGGGAALTPAEREAVQLYMNRPIASGAAGAAGREAAGANGAAGAARGAPQDSVAEIANADKVGSTATRTGGSTNTAGWQMTAAETSNEQAALSSFRTIPEGLSPLKLVAEVRDIWAKGVKRGFEDPARLAAAVHKVYGLSPDEATRLVLLIKDGEAGRGALAPLFRSADAYGATLPKAGREAAAGAGRAGEAAGSAPKTGAGEATGSVSEGVDSASQELIQHIRSGTLDEMERARIYAIADAVRVPGMLDASTEAVLNEARFAGLIP